VRYRVRRRWMGPKHGIARGVAVFTSPTSGPAEMLTGPIAGTDRLREWSLAHGVVLADDLASLEVIDAHIDQWFADPSHHESVDLGNEVGIYLGNVIVKNVAGCRWRVWPNGHPVIALASGLELDVTAKVSDRILQSGSSLHSIYATASSV
jgi:hypothetical protein